MPKTTIFLAILLCCILSAGQTFALSDAEYNSLAKNSSEFRQADKELNKFWKVTIGQLDGDYKKQVLNEQRQWVKTGWDKTAQKFMAQGLSKSAAYTKAIQERINQLRVIRENSSLGEDELGNAKADDYYNASENTEPEKTGSLLGEANGARQSSKPEPMPQMRKGNNYLMEQNLKSQQNLVHYLDIVNNTVAKVQSSSGRAYPILPVLSRSIEEYGQFDKKLAQAMIENYGNGKLTEPKQILDAMNSAWNSIGYSMEATCSQLFKSISPRQYFYLTGHKVMDLCIPIIQFFKDDKLLKTALENGYISKEAAIGFIDASLRYYKAMEKVDNDGVRLPN